MDIKDLAKVNKLSNDGVWVDIKHPYTGEKLPIRFKVLGSQSDKFFKLKEDFYAARFAAAAEGKDNTDELKLGLIAGLVVDIEGLEKNGKPMKDAMEVFKTEGLMFIYHQLDEEVNKKENFTQPA